MRWVRLDAMKTGESGSIIAVDTKNQLIIQKMIAFGIYPGMQCSVVRQGRITVVRLGQTTVALDHFLANTIKVALR